MPVTFTPLPLKGNTRKSTARYSFPLPLVKVESHKKWRNKGSFYNNLQIHLEELILDVF